MVYRLLTIYVSRGGIGQGESRFNTRAKASKAFIHARSNPQTILACELQVQIDGVWKRSINWRNPRYVEYIADKPNAPVEGEYDRPTKERISHPLVRSATMRNNGRRGD